MTSSWQRTPLRDLATFARGVSWSKSEESHDGSGTVVVSIPNIKQRLDIDGAKHRLKERPKASKLLALDDVLFVGSSGSIHNVARNARVTTLPREAVAFASFTFKATPNSEVCDPEFFYYLMNSPLTRFADFARRAADGKFNFQLSDFVARSSFVIPEKAEQQQIASVLSVVQRAIERQERLIALGAELKKALMHQFFTRGTRREPVIQTEIGLVPESWTVSELQKHSEAPQYGFTASAAPTGNAQLLRITDIQETGVDWQAVPRCEIPSDEFDKYRLLSGDLVFARIGATTGKNFLVLNPPQDVIFASYLIRVRTRASLNSQFLAFYCQTAPYWRQIAASKGNNLKGGFNSSLLRRLLVPIPSNVSEQETIADALEAVDQKNRVSRRTVAALNSLFRTLLHQLMTAAVRVDDLDVSALEQFQTKRPAGA